jgi:hypothetical protein
LGAALMALFAGECFFAYFYARHQGLAPLIPALEPWVSACFAIASVGLLVLRERRRRLRRRHIRVQAESAALGRIGPLFAHVRNELRDQLDGIAAELRRLETEPGPGVAVPRMWRTVNRLVTVGEELRLLGPGAEGGGSEIAESLPLPSVADPSEQLLRDRDAYLGAAIFATIGAGTTGLFFLLSAFGPMSRPSLVLMTLLGATTLAYLVASWRRPSERRALAIVLFLWGTGSALASYHQWQVLAVGRPYAPFLGHKLLLLVLPIAAASRLRLSLVLIVLTALNAVVLYFALHIGAHKDIVPLAEPWVTLGFGLTAVAVALADEQRRVASLEILRAESQNAALHRYAGLMLALRDQLNSPLQTMMLCAPQLELRYQAQAVAPIFAAVTRLTTLSRELADLDHLVPSEAHRAAVDAAEELRRRV